MFLAWKQRKNSQIMDSHWTYPEQPWSRVHVDFAGPINGQSFLAVVNTHSKWPEIFPTKNTDTLSTISIFKRLFSQLGLPETLVYDNKTIYIGVVSALLQIKLHYACSSTFISPSINDQSERLVDTFKGALLKAKRQGITEEILQTFLLCNQTTCNSTVKK